MADLGTLIRDWASLCVVATALWIGHVEIKRLRQKARRR